MKQVMSNNAPQPVGPYSQAIESNGFVFLSGQIGLKDGGLVEGIEAQTRQALTNLSSVLQEAGLSSANVVKTTIFIINMEDYQTVNAIYKEWTVDPAPARSTIGVNKLPAGALVEIECIAAIS
jgi:2-iminobutanoate/2-iminopropanoate deaminase